MNELEEEFEYKKNSSTPNAKQSRIGVKRLEDFQNVKKDVKRISQYKSSFHSQKATSHSLEHMKRETKVNYLLIHDSTVNQNKKYKNLEVFKEDAKRIYLEKIRQKMQPKAKENLIKEAVLNIKPNTTIEDIERTFKTLNKRFGGHYILSQSLHFDEGVFIDSKYKLEDLEYTSSTLSWKHIGLDKDVTNDVIDYAPNRNIFYNKDDKSWYFDKEFEKKADTSKLQMKINYHAHVLYSNFDKQSGKTARMNRTDMRELQSIVADSLGMKRGIEFSKNKRMNHWQQKKAHDAKRDLKLKTKSELARLKDLKQEMKLLREELKGKDSTREDYAKLEAINNELESKIRNKELSIEDLQDTMNEKLKTIDYINGKLSSYEQRERERGLTVKGEISKERVTISTGLLKKEERLIYNKESVESYIEKTKSKESELTRKIDSLEKERNILKEKGSQLDSFKVFTKGYFRTSDLNKVKELIKEKIPKPQIDKSMNKDRGYERD